MTEKDGNRKINDENMMRSRKNWAHKENIEVLRLVIGRFRIEKYYSCDIKNNIIFVWYCSLHW